MKNNPFTLTFGKKPTHYIDRFENQLQIVDAFSAENSICQIYLISGVRGSGKTVLMTAIAKELTATGDWISVELNSARDLLEDLAQRLKSAIDSKLKTKEFDIGLNIAGISAELSSSKDETDTISLIQKYLEKAKRKKKRVLITIDEVSINKSMREFASQFQIFVRQEYPVYLIMTGLHNKIYSVQTDPQLTFLLRSPKIELEPLSIHQIVCQYKSILGIGDDLAKILAGHTKGYAFAFQALGYLYWEFRDALPLDQIIIKYEGLLDDFVYKKIWDDLSEREKEIVTVLSGKQMAVSTKEIREKLDMSEGNISKYRAKLLKDGIITPKGHGYIVLSLPRFGEIIKTYVGLD